MGEIYRRFACMPKKSSPGNSGVGARFRELRLEVVLKAIATEDELEELEGLGYEEEMGYEGAVGRGGDDAILPSIVVLQ